MGQIIKSLMSVCL